MQRVSVTIFEKDYGPDAKRAAKVYCATHDFNGVIVFQQINGDLRYFAVDSLTQITCRELPAFEVDESGYKVEEPAETPVAVAAEPTKCDGIEHRTEPVRHWIFDGHAYRVATEADVGKTVWVTDGNAKHVREHIICGHSYYQQILVSVGDGLFATHQLDHQTVVTWNFAVIRDDSLLEPATTPAKVPELVLPEGYEFVWEGLVQKGDMIASVTFGGSWGSWVEADTTIGATVENYFGCQGMSFAVCRPIPKPAPPEPVPTFKVGDWVLLSDHDEDPEWRKWHNAHVGMLRQVVDVNPELNLTPIRIAEAGADRGYAVFVKPEWLELTTPPEQWRVATEADIGKPCRFRDLNSQPWKQSKRLLYIYTNEDLTVPYVCLNERGMVTAWSQCEVRCD